jgi:hypothetical protein
MTNQIRPLVVTLSILAAEIAFLAAITALLGAISCA